jgi:hypothetical protein
MECFTSFNKDKSIRKVEDCTKLNLLHDEAKLIDLMHANPKFRKENIMPCCLLVPMEVRNVTGHYWYVCRKAEIGLLK